MALVNDFAEMNQRITFNSKQTIKINGVPTEKDGPVGTVWSKVLTQRLADRMANIGNEVTNVITFVIRKEQDFAIDNKMTVTWGAQTYQIKNIDPTDPEWKSIICEVITA